jgi:hypothetical protein
LFAVYTPYAYAGGNACTGPVESHFATYLTCVAKGLNETNIARLVINVLLGMKGTGEEDPFHNYFAIFNRLYAEKTKGGPTRATANNRRNAEGAWLAVREESKLEDEGCPDYIVKVDPRLLAGGS